jgi:nitrite reductase/ring-hydroxylating ferredoxin subunit
MLIEAAKTVDIAPGGMLGVKLNGVDLVICNNEGMFYAVGRKCGHAAAYLERGTLTGHILTCPLHYAQFDVTTGEALSGPVPDAPLSKYPDPSAPDLKTSGLKTYPVEVEAGLIKVDLP